jgi:hypothetical protein
VGSSKQKPKPSKKPSQKPSKQPPPEPSRPPKGSRALQGKASRGKALAKRATRGEPTLGEVIEVLRAQQVELARITALLEDHAASRTTLAQQTERILELQERTNTLLELSLGAAFDFELEGPRRTR